MVEIFFSKYLKYSRLKKYIGILYILIFSMIFSNLTYAANYESHLGNHYAGRIVNHELGDFMAKDLNLDYSPIVGTPTNKFMPENAYYSALTSYNNFHYKLGNMKSFNEGYNFRIGPVVDAVITDKSTFMLIPFFSGGWHWFRSSGSDENSFTNKTSTYLGGLTIGATYEINRKSSLRQSVGIKTGFAAGSLNYESTIDGNFQKYYSTTANYIAEIFYTIYAKYLPVNIFSRYTYEFIEGYTLSDFILDDISENRLMFGFGISPILLKRQFVEMQLMLSTTYEYNFNNTHGLKNSNLSIDVPNHNTRGNAVLRIQTAYKKDKSIAIDFGFSQHFNGVKGSTVFINISYGIFDGWGTEKKFSEPVITHGGVSEEGIDVNDTEAIKKHFKEFDFNSMIKGKDKDKEKNK